MNEDYLKPCCYFYIDDKGKCAYVGKSNGSLSNRINAHAREMKFINCKCSFDIRYVVFENENDMVVAEKAYIKSLNPYLNVIDRTCGFFPQIHWDINEFKKYIPPCRMDVNRCKNNLIYNRKTVGVKHLTIKKLRENGNKRIAGYFTNLVLYLQNGQLERDDNGKYIFGRYRTIEIPNEKRKKTGFSFLIRNLYKLDSFEKWSECGNNISFEIKENSKYLYLFFIFEIRKRYERVAGTKSENYVDNNELECFCECIKESIAEVKKKKDANYIFNKETVHFRELER